MMTICKIYTITGRVQGVWFRAGTQKTARKMDITGWAKNLPDRSVQVLACGSEENIERFAAWLQQLGRKRPRLFPKLISPARETRADGAERGALHCSPLDSPSPLTPLQAAEISHFKKGPAFAKIKLITEEQIPPQEFSDFETR